MQVPINKQFSIAELMKACREYPGLKPSRRMTFEYVMLKVRQHDSKITVVDLSLVPRLFVAAGQGINDSTTEARQLGRLLKDLPSLVNLIPFNPW